MQQTSSVTMIYFNYNKPMKTLAVIPAYNEEESIVDTIHSFVNSVNDIDYLIVNDGSTDKTREVCESNRFNIVNLPVNMGLAGAFQTGMKYAYRNQYDAVLQFDADGQHLPQFCWPMIDAMVENDVEIVIGSRFVNKKKNASARMFGSSIISSLIKLTTGKKIMDPTSGMRLYNRRIIELFARGHDITPEPDTLAYCIRKGALVCEVPVEMNDRIAGESYFNFSRSVIYMLRTCISILILQWFR